MPPPPEVTPAHHGEVGDFGRDKNVDYVVEMVEMVG
jgi:hypothetical protein